MGWEVRRYRPDFLTEFGTRRVLDIPVSELGAMGVAVGAARSGKRVVLDLYGASFFMLALDQIVNSAAITEDTGAGRVPISIVLRGFTGIGDLPAGSTHSRMLHPLFMTIPGLTVVYPSCPEDVKGLMRASIRSGKPVIFLEHLRMLSTVAEGDIADDMALGPAVVRRAGRDVTVVAIGPCVREALNAAVELARLGIDAEVIDPQVLAPLDTETIVASARRTGRLLVVDEAHDRCSAASHIAAVVAERAWDALRAPVRRLTVPDINIPFDAARRWQAFCPTAPDVVRAAALLCAPTGTRQTETARD
jgi:pyruvate dehydrogenase E1 component beta subunit